MFTSIVVFLGALIYFLVVRGPRAYVVPDDAPETEPEPTATSDVSQVDVTGGDDGGAKTPKGYQVVSEARFQAYRRTGILPPDTPEDMAEEIAAGGHPVERDPAGPAGVGEAVLATGATAGTGPDGASGGDVEPEPRDER